MSNLHTLKCRTDDVSDVENGCGHTWEWESHDKNPDIGDIPRCPICDNYNTDVIDTRSNTITRAERKSIEARREHWERRHHIGEKARRKAMCKVHESNIEIAEADRQIHRCDLALTRNRKLTPQEKGNEPSTGL